MIERNNILASHAIIYNARWMAPAEVAKTFVPPACFNALLQPKHTVLVGPRGSGKTTLLKMLCGAAIDAWKHPDAAGVRRNLAFRSVFVATDVTWHSQLNAIGKSILSPEQQDAIQWAAVTAHAARALVNTMEYEVSSLRQSGVSTDGFEVDIARGIAKAWNLDVDVASFFGLTVALDARIEEISALVEREKLRTADGRGERLASIPFLAARLFSMVTSGTRVFDKYVSVNKRPWALLFDELELMPDHIRSELFRMLRSTDVRPDQPVLIKLSFSPFSDRWPFPQDPDAPQPGHDFDLIRLWYADKAAAKQFCRQLWESVTTGTRWAGISAASVLGTSLQDVETKEWQLRGTAYTNDSEHAKAIRTLATIDPSFREYLDANKINPNDIRAVGADERAKTLRKVFPIIIARLHELRPSSDENAPGVEQRSRKIPDLYVGTSGMFSLTEGNPRLFKALIGGVLAANTKGPIKVGKKRQAREIHSQIARAWALLRTVVVPEMRTDRQQLSLTDLLERVGYALRSEVLGNAFNPEPPESFIVDDDVPIAQRRVLGHALNLGAVVLVPDEETDDRPVSAEYIVGRRCRLCYLLAAKYGLPLRKGRAVRLSRLLGTSGASTLFGGDSV